MPSEAFPDDPEHDIAADAALFAGLRAVWERVDPAPADLVDRMVAAVAVSDLSREYALLTIVDGAERAAVRGEADTVTLQFGDGSTSVLVHVTVEEGGTRRIDGWTGASVLAVRIVQERGDRLGEVGEHGRFAVERVAHGLSRLRLVVRDTTGEVREFETPQFEV